MTVLVQGPYRAAYSPEYEGTPSDVGGTHLRVYDVTGTRLRSVIPELEQATVQDERNQPGQLVVSLAMSATGVAQLATSPAALIGLYEQGRLVGMYLYDEDSDDEADLNGPDAELSVTAPGVMAVLAWAAVYPQGGFGAPQYADFVQQTPGAILLSVLTGAQSRGTLDGINGPKVTCSFSALADSDGRPWPATVWVRYNAGKSMLDVVNDLAGRGYIDVRMRGLVLDAYVAGGAPDVSRSPIPAAVADDAQGWQAVSGCTVARDAAVVPPTAPGVTASVRLTGAVPAIVALQATVNSTKATLDAAQATLDADTKAVAAADAAAKRKMTSAEKAELAADRAALDTAQKAYAAAQSALAGALNQLPLTDMEADTVAAFPVVGGTSYDAGVYVHADAVTRVCSLSVAFRDAAGHDLTSAVVGSTTDTPSGWGQINGQVAVPPAATQAVLHLRVVGAQQGELHYAALPVMSPSVGTTLSKDLPSVVLLRPAYVQQAPRRRQRSPIRTALLGLGEANLSLESADADAIALYGRREGAASQGGVADYPTLQRLTQLALDQAKRPAIGWTVTYSRVTGDTDLPVPQPGRDYLVGNQVRCDWIRWPDLDPTSTSQAMAPVRVSSITAQYDSGGVASATVELADVFMDEDVKLQRQITGLLMGASSADPLGATPVTVDVLAPVPVSALFVGSSVLLRPDGTYEALATITWPAVISNTDGTPFDDLGWYAVDYRVGFFPDTSDGWQAGARVQTLETGVGGLPPNAEFQARVLPVDFNGNYPTNADGSPAYTYSAPAPLGTDNQGPGAPSAPTVTSLPGGLAISWNGLDTAGAGMPPDYQQVEVHVSTVPGFTTAVGNLVDTILGTPSSASTVITTPLLQYGQDYYVRLVARDTAGNASLDGAIFGPVRIRLIGPADLDPAVLTNTDHSGMFPADLLWAGGTLQADAAARDGQAMKLAPGQTAAGVNYAGLKPGRYRATWVIRTDAAAASPAANLANVNVTGAGVASDGQRVVTTADAASLTGYRTVAVRFTVTAGTNSVDLPLANAYTAGNVWLSHAYIEPVQSIALAEIRDAMVADLSATKLTAGSLTADVIAAMDANGKPGRIRVGIVNPATGVADQPGFSLGADGFRSQAAGGVQTLLIDNGGNVTVTGSITAGSTLPGSVYSSNLVANASMEDLVPGTAANVAGTVPAGWTDGYETTGAQQSAYADATGSIGGTRSLTVQCDDVNSGRGVASQSFAVVPGERLQVVTQLKQTGAARNPVIVRVVFGTAPGFARSGTVGTGAATPDSCVLLNLDGSVATQLVGAGGGGYADVMASVLPPALNVAYKAAGSVVVPAGATWARLVLYQWARGGAVGGTVRTTFDNAVVERSKDGHAISSATITGPTIRTAAGNVIRVEITGNPTSQQYVGPQVNFYQTSATAPPARIYTLDYTTIPGFMQAVPNINLQAPAFAPYTWSSEVTLVPNQVGIAVRDSATNTRLAYAEYGTGVINTEITNLAGTLYTLIQQQTGSWVLSSATSGNLINAQAGGSPTVSLAADSIVAGYQLGGQGVVGSGSGLKLDIASEVRCAVPNLNSYAACRASSFPLSSTAEQKTDIAEFPAGYALDAVLYAPAKAWRYETPAEDYDGPTRGSADRGLHVFPVLEELPSEVWHDAESVDLRDVVGVLWQSVRELAGRVEQLAGDGRG